MAGDVTPERWSQLERLYHEALECPRDRRAAFLARECAGEHSLRQAVESLIAHDERASHYLSAPVQSLPTSLELQTSSPESPVRVAVVRASRSPEADSFHQLLLRRLRISSLILAGTAAALLAYQVWDLSNAAERGVVVNVGGPGFVRFELVSHGLAAVVSASFGLLLWWKPPVSTRTVRAIELLLIGSIAGVILWTMAYPEWYWLLQQTAAPPRDLRAFRGAYVESTSLRWFGLLVGYGALIPNTWRRCAVVVGVLAATPLVFLAVLTLWVRPVDIEVAQNALSGLALWIGVAAALVVFTAYRVELLREQAAEARKLGQYVLKELLGSGGMGEVYLADHVLLRRPCAIKLIRPERAGDAKYLQRFTREVQRTATLTHPNTVQVFDYGHAADGTFYYVMEYLGGLTVHELVRQHGAVPPSRAIYLLRQVCAALEEAHGIGLIHRDIKPGNIMVCERGGRHDVIKLLDFGLVLPIIDADEEALPHEGIIAGTPAYMSPEQAGGQSRLDARSDIYSVGALAYFLLTGQPPFVCGSSVRTLAAHLFDSPAPLSGYNADTPSDLEAIVLRCLSKAPDDRFTDAHSLGKALATCRCADEWADQDAANWWRAHGTSDSGAAEGPAPHSAAGAATGNSSKATTAAGS